jgi:hypothetical protein
MGLVRWSVLWSALILLLCMPALAQEDGGPSEGQYDQGDAGAGAPGPDDECPGAEVVETIEGSGFQETAPFRITGERFRVTTTATPDDGASAEDVLIGIIVETSNGRVVGVISKEGPGTESAIQNEGPGDFVLDITPANASYSIVVEDCVDTQGNPPAGDDGDVNDPDDVVPGTGDDKPLPDTGGFPLLLGAAALALSAALLARRTLAR